MHTCIFGSSGRIGSIFKRLFPMASLFYYNHDYDNTHVISKDCIARLQTSNILVLCHHNLKDPFSYRQLTVDILKYLPNDNNITIINIASDAEILPIPFRIQYGNAKKYVRRILESRKNRVITVFTPYITMTNIGDYEQKVQEIHKQGWKFDFYYLSMVSSIARPWKVSKSVDNLVFRGLAYDDPYLAKFVYDTNSLQSTSNFEHRKILDTVLYKRMMLLLEYHLRVKLVETPSTFMGYISWLLLFKDNNGTGKMHQDMRRCLFGSLFRCIICIKDTSDYQIRVGSRIYKLKQGDVLVIPDGTYHQPLQMTHGERTICILDYFTSNIVNVIAVIFFLIFNKFKAIGINV